MRMSGEETQRLDGVCVGEQAEEEHLPMTKRRKASDGEASRADSSMNSVGSETKRPWKLRDPVHAHFDCFSGAAGDMMLAACLDAAGEDGGCLLEHIVESLNKGLPPLAGEFGIQRKQVWRGSGSIVASHVSVSSVYNHASAPVPTRRESVSAPEHSHSHGHGHSHGHADSSQSGDKRRHGQHDRTSPVVNAPLDNDVRMGHSHSHTHNVSDAVSHEHKHRHNTSSAKAPLRNLPEIRKMLQDAPEKYIPEWVRETAIDCFTQLAFAEAAVHGAAGPEDVHFHEVGAVDSIVDMVGTILALYYLGVKTISCGPLPLGEGAVKTDHGILPVPAPATLCLMIGMATTPGPPGVTGELVTPTGAALLRVLTGKSGQAGLSGRRAPRFTLRSVGVGAGTKDFPGHPNILRLMLGDATILPVTTRNEEDDDDDEDLVTEPDF